MHRRKSQFILLWATLLTIAMSLSMAVAQTSLPTLILKAGAYHIKAEVAATRASRELGLMNRLSLPADSGMLFVHPVADTYCMWMRNTLIPLSVAFLDDKGKIVNIADMQPLTENNHCAAKPVRYELEMNLGWFRKRGIGPGTHISGLEKAPLGR
jgi:uncharacterized membrane protein (UPF0127 family)